MVFPCLERIPWTWLSQLIVILIYVLGFRILRAESCSNCPTTGVLLSYTESFHNFNSLIFCLRFLVEKYNRIMKFRQLIYIWEIKFQPVKVCVCKTFFSPVVSPKSCHHSLQSVPRTDFNLSTYKTFDDILTKLQLIGTFSLDHGKISAIISLCVENCIFPRWR